MTLTIAAILGLAVLGCFTLGLALSCVVNQRNRLADENRQLRRALAERAGHPSTSNVRSIGGRA